ncbi:hypothetical protein OVY01_11295 [Robbsia sp. Bb-Pol-6]|uniref:Uncharacterized protein n=1 Tax=Robbsia betulipollinis TaxID=2981849 RepID=A0ABT3ZMP0_9BURK|nr:hypothetical protein [Robbsia betulipollinis]MCY0387808.1 hypothetical protein [Robbsia betulipollinis]
MPLIEEIVAHRPEIQAIRRDPIAMQIARAWRTIVSRNTDPNDAAMTCCRSALLIG